VLVEVLGEVQSLCFFPCVTWIVPPDSSVSVGDDLLKQYLDRDNIPKNSRPGTLLLYSVQIAPKELCILLLHFPF
jgi:hypothetical protein